MSYGAAAALQAAVYQHLTEDPALAGVAVGLPAVFLGRRGHYRRHGTPVKCRMGADRRVRRPARFG